MRILVLGGGQQGRVIAGDLAASLPEGRIEVADLRRPNLPAADNLSWLEADLGDAAALPRLLADYDLAVGALPSRLGHGVMQAAIEAGVNLVDVSFSAEDPLALEGAARRAGVTLVPDCGLAPGLSNLVVGKAVFDMGSPSEVMIYVGGVAADPTRPYGYVITWAPEDLLEEYVRPARIVRGGEAVTVPVFSGMERVEIDGVGEMEAFYSDGLRTLIHTIPSPGDLGEKTLRWPGHAEAVQKLVAEDRLVEELRAHCSADPPEDLVAMLVRVRWGGRGRDITLVDRYDAARGLTAMSRTTAFTTAVVAQLAARGGLAAPGVKPLELVARDERAFTFIYDEMARRGVRLRIQQV